MHTPLSQQVFARTGRALLFFLLIAAKPGWSQTDRSLSALDWVPKEQLSEEQAALCPENCAGAYIAPARNDADANTPPGEADIQGEADSSEINTDTQTAIMQGHVVFTQGWRQMESERVEIDRDNEILKLQGEVKIREPGLLFIGEKAEINSENETLSIEQAQYLFHEQRIRGSADKISRASTTGIVIDNASYTACEPGDNAWVLYADQIDINEETGRATAKGVKIETEGVPVFYAPYFQFIVDDRRATGILYPELGYSSDEGFQYRQPIYINLAENQDMTITPTYTARRGSGLEAEYRLLTPSSYTTTAGAYYPDDDINPVHRDDRWMGAITHRGFFGDVRTRIDLQEVSDDDFMDDWGTNAFDVDNRDIFLRQHASIAANYGHWTFAAAATDYQNLIEDVFREYRELPRISADGSYQFANGISLELNNEWVSFDHSLDNVLVDLSLPGTQRSTDGTWVTGDRLRSNWAVSMNNQAAWGFIKPKIGASYLGYDLDSPVTGWNDDTPDAFAAEASLDAGLIFERQTSFGMQTLEPRFYYLYRDADDQWGMPVFDTTYATESLEQLFRNSEFVGGDRLEEANRATFGLWSRFYNSSNREVMSLGIGQTYYLSDRETTLALLPPLTAPVEITLPAEALESLITSGSVFLISSGLSSPAGFLQDIQEQANEFERNRSDIIGEAKWNISDDWALKSSLFWDDSSSDLERSRLELAYNPIDSASFLKLAYMQEDNYISLFDSNDNGFIEESEYINQDIEQLSLSGQIKLSDRWSVVFLWQEDMENDRNLDKVAGISYESCCWNLSLSWQDQLQRSTGDGFVVESPRRDKSIVLSFEFKGLGGIGTSARNLVIDR